MVAHTICCRKRQRSSHSKGISKDEPDANADTKYHNGGIQGGFQQIGEYRQANADKIEIPVDRPQMHNLEVLTLQIQRDSGLATRGIVVQRRINRLGRLRANGMVIDGEVPIYRWHPHCNRSR